MHTAKHQKFAYLFIYLFNDYNNNNNNHHHNNNNLSHSCLVSQKWDTYFIADIKIIQALMDIPLLMHM